MLKNDCVQARYDDSCKLIVLELILLRRIGHDSFAMKAIMKHAATTMNGLETKASTSTGARQLIPTRAKNPPTLVHTGRSFEERVAPSRSGFFADSRLAHTAGIIFLRLYFFT